MGDLCYVIHNKMCLTLVGDSCVLCICWGQSEVEQLHWPGGMPSSQGVPHPLGEGAVVPMYPPCDPYGSFTSSDDLAVFAWLSVTAAWLACLSC